jgi:predicted CopG family antitoxin
MGTEHESARLIEEAYETLRKRKRDDETFSEVVERLAEERPIRDVAGLFSDEEVEAIRSARTNRYGGADS